MPDLELLRALAPPVEPASPAAVARARRYGKPRRRPLVIATPVAAGAAVLAIVLTQLGGGREFAEAAIRAAQASPRLLVDGWKVTRVDEWDAGTGEMTFADGARTLQLRWNRVDNGDKDLIHVASTTVAGATADVGRYDGGTEFVARWTQGDAHVEARGSASGAEAFIAALRAVHRVSAEAWLSALPESAVAPKAQAGTIDAMLKGIPLPPGFHAPTASADETRDRYQLGAKVAGAVVCAWIERWIAGDPNAAHVLAGSRGWPLLHQMDAEGDYPEVVWQYADAINSGGDAPGGKPGLTVADTYKDAFGC